MSTTINIERQFAEVLALAGLATPEIIADGKLHRFNAGDEKRGRESGYYVLFPDSVPTGVYGDWRTGLYGKWSARSESEMSAAERAEFRARVRHAMAARKAEEARNAQAAREIVTRHWDVAGGVRSDHPYVLAKGIRPCGAKQVRDALLIPLRDIEGVLRSAQYIQPDGTKRFKSGGRIAGCFCMVGDEPANDGTVLIAEGWATACSLYQATGYTVFAAMNAGNLIAVSNAVRGKYADSRIVVCADDDFQTEGNPGMTKARSAAQAVGGDMAVPEFGPDRESGVTDFNDLHRLHGLDAVRRCVEAAMVVARSQPEPDLPRDCDGKDSGSMVESGLAASHAEGPVGGPAQEDVPENMGACASPGGELQAYFDARRNGLYYVGVKRGHETGKMAHVDPLWLCSALEVLGNGRDEAGRQHRVLRWHRKGNREEIHHTMPNADIGEREGWATMRSLGLSIAPGRAPRERLAYYLQEEGGDVWHEITGMTGWQYGAFVLPSGEFVGKPSCPLVYNGGVPKKSAYLAAGTLDTWKNTVGALARENPLVVAAIACAFAGPLLSIIGVRDGIGLHFYTQSSSGKSTAGDCAASVWGEPRDIMHSWNATSFGLTRTAEYANDGLLYLDEIGAGDARKIGPAIYQMLNGVSRLQGTKSGGVVASRSWRLTLISTGEVAMSQYLSEGGLTPRGGQEVRLLDVPADGGEYRAFDRIHGHKDGDEFSTELTVAARTHYGTAGRAFVQWLMAHRHEVGAWVKAAQDDMVGAVDAQHPDAAPTVKRATRKWGVLAAVAEMASEAGLTGWTRGEARTWVMSAWARWLEAFGTGNRDDERLIEQVESLIEQHEHSRFVRLPLTENMPVVHNSLGFLRTDADGKITVYVPPATFKSVFVQGYDLKQACKALHKVGILLRPAGRNGWTKNGGRGFGQVYVLYPRKNHADWKADDDQ